MSPKRSLRYLASSAALACALLVSAPTARAGECPERMPEHTDERRALAKAWFSNGEAAVERDDHKAAIDAFACSLRLVPHASTAYNLGALAEKTGDLELAVTSYRTYLTLAADATNSDEIRRKIEELEKRLSSVRE